MKYSFHPEAQAEFIASVSYYEDCQEGLGLDFSGEVFSAIQRIIHFPKSWSKLSKNTRRCLTNRFPFGVIFQVVGDELLIIAVMQLNRKPNYWNKRIK